MIYFYGPYERMYIFWPITGFLTIVNIFLIMPIFKCKEVGFNNKRIFYSLALFYPMLLIAIFVYSSFQFNYVVMPRDYFTTDVFPVTYDYSDLKGTVRIEYFSRDYYGNEEIYRESYDKDEIKEFLEFFRDSTLASESVADEVPNSSLDFDWENDILVVIRNMKFEDDGYQIFNVHLVDTSSYVLIRDGASPKHVYEIQDDLRLFIEEHLLLDT